MPLFIMISRYVFSLTMLKAKEINSEKYKKQMINPVWICFLFNILYGLVKIIMSQWVNSEVTWLDLWLIPLKVLEIYWYMYVLIIIYLMMRLVIK